MEAVKAKYQDRTGNLFGSQKFAYISGSPFLSLENHTNRGVGGTLKTRQTHMGFLGMVDPSDGS